MSNFYVYKTTNLINNKIYIGQRKGKFKKSYYGSGLNIVKAVAKYGVINFSVEVLEYCFTVDEANIREVYWISEFKSCDKSIGYNIDLGGKNRLVSQSTRLKMSLSHTGKKLSPEHIANMIKANLGTKHTEETKAKMRLAATGRKLSEETKRKVGLASKNRVNAKKGAKLSDETKALIGLKSKGRNLGGKHKPETLLKMKEARINYWNNKLGRV